ncbi:hypothetical protein BLOT_011456 [Blomia tropicalis]|nr:hypothetical protein BLOT_011456 [Blomia tropicalis]
MDGSDCNDIVIRYNSTGNWFIRECSKNIAIDIHKNETRKEVTLIIFYEQLMTRLHQHQTENEQHFRNL